jgi:aerobic-type carbon monoxide dehydrogenase small subunit (CoxS/CutS family)
MKLDLILNGKALTVEVASERTLLQILREDLGLTGTKSGCDNADCGVCSVLLDGRLAKSCLLEASKLQGSRITTIEGIHGDVDGLSDLQHAFLRHGAIQCGYCIPAMILAGEAILQRNPTPSRDEIRRGLVPVLCRCTGYQQIIDAIEETAQERRATAVNKVGQGELLR